MIPQVVVGVDGGNTKTIAAVATTEGEVLGAAVGPSTDIYGRVSPEDALEVLAGVVREAVASAGAGPGAVASVASAASVAATVGSLAGADWPEDFDLYRSELRARVGLGGHLEVVNDGVGPLRLGDPGGQGVAVVLGTAAAVGARGPDGAIWNASFWLPFGAAEWLGKKAVAAVSEAALGIGRPTSLTETLLAFFGASDEETMLHMLTRRGSAFAGGRWERDTGRLLLDQDGAGDPVARDIVAEYARLVAPYAMVAAGKVRITGAFNVVLTGGLLRHPTSALARRLAAEIVALDAKATVVTVTTAPVAGAVLEAIALTGKEVTRELVGAVSGSELLVAVGGYDAFAAAPGATSAVRAWGEPSGEGGPIYDAVGAR